MPGRKGAGLACLCCSHQDWLSLNGSEQALGPRHAMQSTLSSVTPCNLLQPWPSPGLRSQVVVDIDGDGSFMMNCQELATAAIEELDVKMVILNNQHLGMVVQWEDRFYKANRAHTYLGRRVRQPQP